MLTRLASDSTKDRDAQESSESVLDRSAGWRYL